DRFGDLGQGFFQTDVGGHVVLLEGRRQRCAGRPLQAWVGKRRGEEPWRSPEGRPARKKGKAALATGNRRTTAAPEKPAHGQVAEEEHHAPRAKDQTRYPVRATRPNYQHCRGR